MTKPTESDLRTAIAKFEDAAPTACVRDLLEGLEAVAEHDDGAADLLAKLRALFGEHTVTVPGVDVPVNGASIRIGDRTIVAYRALDEIEERMRDRIRWVDEPDDDGDRAYDAWRDGGGAL